MGVGEWAAAPLRQPPCRSGASGPETVFPAGCPHGSNRLGKLFIRVWTDFSSSLALSPREVAR